MKLIKREEPGKGLEVRDFHDAFQDLVRSFWDDDYFPTNLAGAEWNFHADVYEKDNKVFVKADIPGMDEKNLDVRIENGKVCISGKREESKETKDGKFHRVERSFGSFSRTISLPEEIDPDKASADYKNGVLTVSIPKSKAAESRKIQIKAS